MRFTAKKRIVNRKEEYEIHSPLGKVGRVARNHKGLWEFTSPFVNSGNTIDEHMYRHDLFDMYRIDLEQDEEYRMYFFVLYNISDIQKGIQAGHAALEYVDEHGNKDDETAMFIRDHKTFILLSGGGSSDMRTREQELRDRNVRYSVFCEPDLDGALSAIAFIVPKSSYEGEGEFAQYLKGFRLA